MAKFFDNVTVKTLFACRVFEVGWAIDLLWLGKISGSFVLDMVSFVFDNCFAQ